ncbi:HNH endonuclease [Paracoccus aminophilus]|uniref:Putative HNH nuclease YajD n=1 Tax=Paracoccus aminophilus JCM 7686 TaxID=1367847 RepID=S5XPJ5_PARAH|nr:HNH endonuclease signature motif containing protein [Paracoccus aminophilus]AGT09264.1 HNH endonuclease [Paracoccus aminophilus JCM 7686]
MPRPPRLCSCGAIVPADQLCACQVERQRERKRRHDQNRPSSSQRGYGTEWRKLRAEFLRVHPCCAFCGAEAQVVDHIKPHRGVPKLLFDWRNLQSLCKPCHDRVKQRMERASNE